MQSPFSLHIRTLTGLEGVLAKELEALGATDIQKGNRLVTCQGDLKLLYAANLWLRTAIRVLRPLASFPAADEKTFYEGVQAINWSQWMRPMGTLSVDAHVHSSFTTHSLFVAQLTKDAIVDQFREKTGERPSVDLKAPDLRIGISLYKDTVQVFADSSGESLHRRGYRLEAGDAPLGETLAAGILKLTGWDSSTPLVDPMCGSGTFLIEAALMASNRAPGLLRKQFGFQLWADYDRALFENLQEQARQAIRSDVSVAIHGVEIDPEVAAIARKNATRAGVADLVHIETADFFAWDKVPDGKGVLVMNPPYDERLSVDNVAELYQSIGDRLTQTFQGWTAYVFSANQEALRCLGLRHSRSLALYNGSLDCQLNQYNLAQSEKIRVAQPWRTQAPEENPEWKAKAETFANRLRKNFKHLSKWARREGITCWRVYNWDVPELPFFVDLYGDEMHFAEVPRNHAHSAMEHASYTQFLVKTAATALGLDPARAHFKERKPKKTGGAQFTPHASSGEFRQIQEGGLKFLVNFTDYLDVGLFLEHRKTRAWIQKASAGKDVLNLYSYTGSFSVYAAAGGAKSTTTVDTASTYLEWAQENLRINGFSAEKHSLVRSDAMEFLSRTSSRYDLCIVDPPTRSINRVSGQTFEVQPDHVRLIKMALDKTRAGGKVLFLTNYRGLQLDESALKENRTLQIKEITAQTIAADFERKPGHRCWLIET